MEAPGIQAQPLRLGGRVRAEWIDYNGHLMDGYYSVAFAEATDACLEAIGFGPAYRARTDGFTVFTVESHVNFVREVHVGDDLEYETLLLDADDRCLHMFHAMLAADSRVLLASNEIMCVHVDQRLGKVCPMPPENLRRARAMVEVHARFGRPADAGRAISMRRH